MRINEVELNSIFYKCLSQFTHSQETCAFPVLYPMGLLGWLEIIYYKIQCTLRHEIKLIKFQVSTCLSVS